MPRSFPFTRTCAMFFTSPKSRNNSPRLADPLLQAFRTPPDNVKAWCWWGWPAASQDLALMPNALAKAALQVARYAFDTGASGAKRSKP
jgi:hypothetical protein